MVGKFSADSGTDSSPTSRTTILARLGCVGWGGSVHRRRVWGGNSGKANAMTTLGRALVFVTLPLLLAGCATLMLVAATATTAHADTTRYTWTGGDVSLLPQVNLACAKDMEDRKSTRLNSSHVAISYAVF